MSNEQMQPRKRNLGFVELPDEALDLFSHYTQLPEWDVVLVVNREGDSYAARMAEILQIPVLDVANRLALLSCNRVVVGDHPASLLASVQEMVNDTAVEVLSLDEALDEAGIQRRETTQEESTAEPVTTSPLDDGLWENWSPQPDEEVLATGLDPNSEPVEIPSPHAAEEMPDPTPPAGEEPPPMESTRVVEETTGGTPLHEVEEPPEPPAEAVEDETAEDAVEPTQGAVEPLREATAPVAEEMESSTEPARSASSENPSDDLPAFDVGSLLGADMKENVGPVFLAPEAFDRLREVLTLAVRATRTQTGSIMLLDADDRYLRVAVSVGLPEHLMARARRRIGEGISGQVFASKTPRIIRGPVPGGADSSARPPVREAASVPILSDGNAIGVFNVNVEAEGKVLDDGTLNLLARFAREASLAILKALDLRRVSPEKRLDVLLRVTDRLMAVQDTLPGRLHAVADALRNAVGADFVHFFVIDPLGRRLELRTPPQGVASWHPKSQPLDAGFLGWVVNQGKPQILEVAGEDGIRRAAMICLPVVTSRPHGLIVLENVVLEDESVTPVEEFLSEAMSHAETILTMEEGIEADELLHQLKMRVLDYVPQVETLPPVQRTRTMLDFAVGLLAGEAAIWVPQEGGRPVTSTPSGPSADLLARVRPNLDLLTEWVRDAGGVAGGAEAPGWDPRAPRGPAPYVGVASADGEGVVLLFFPPDETVGSPAQVSAQVLMQVLVEIGAFCSPRFQAGARGAPSKALAAVPDSERLYDVSDLVGLVHHEYLRSRRYGHSFALTRFRLPQVPPSSDPEKMLRDFLVANKRGVDMLGRTREATYLMLSPEVEKDPEGIVKRLSGLWKQSYPDFPLEIEQRVFPRDGEVEDSFRSWISRGVVSEEAA